MMFIGQFYKTEAQATARIKELMYEDHGRRKWYVIVGKPGYLVVGESALRNAGLLPRRKRYTKKAV